MTENVVIRDRIWLDLLSSRRISRRMTHRSFVAFRYGIISGIVGMVALLSVDPRAAADIRVMILDGESGGPYRLAARDAC